MAQVAVSGFSDFAEELKKVDVDLRGRILVKACEATAEVLRGAVEAKAPLGLSGVLWSSIMIYRRKNPRMFQADEDNEARYLVGPSKQAFYAYFLEFGYTARAKGDIVVRTRAGGKSSTRHFTKENLGALADRNRRLRPVQKAIAQKSASGGKLIPPKPFVRPAFDASIQQALEAGRDVIRRELGNA